MAPATARHRRPPRFFPPERRLSINTDFTNSDTARNRAARAYFQRDLTGNATRRETTSGRPGTNAPNVCPRASCACTKSCVRASRQRARQKPMAPRAIPPRRAASNSGDPARASSVDSTPSAASPSIRRRACHWPPRMSLPASRCRMRISSCFSLWRISETCRTPPCRRWSSLRARRGIRAAEQSS